MVEKRLHKIIPNSIDIIVTPTITLLLIGLLTIFIIMPLAGFVSDGLVYVINWIIGVGEHFQWIHYRSILFTFSHARITSYLHPNPYRINQSNWLHLLVTYCRYGWCWTSRCGDCIVGEMR